MQRFPLQPPLRNPYDFSQSSSNADSGGGGSRWQSPGYPGTSSGHFGEDAIQATDTDAAVSRLSAVNLGYIRDPYVRHLVRRPQTRPPIINRGTYLRHEALNQLLRRFFASFLASRQQHAQQFQVVLLGSGSDTRYFQLEELLGDAAVQGTLQRFVEIDFPDVVARKSAVLQRNAAFRNKLQLSQDANLSASSVSGTFGARLPRGGRGKNATSPNQFMFSAGNYTLLGADLRKWEAEVVPMLLAELDLRLPTFWLNECALIYMDAKQGDEILTWIATNQEHACVATYEPILPDDTFGRMMLQNLQTRGIQLPAIHQYPDLARQRARYTQQCGWKHAEACDMNAVYEQWISDAEKVRVNKIELLDELEEWRMLMAHYCIAYAWQGCLTLK